MKWGNWAVAKLVEVLFNTSHISDVGCTYRLLDRRLVDYIAENMQIGGSHAGPEIMLLTITSGARFVEIPVNYLPRVGRSSVTGSRHVAFGLGLRMIGLILRFRIKHPRALPRPTAFEASTACPTTLSIGRSGCDSLRSVAHDEIARVEKHPCRS